MSAHSDMLKKLLVTKKGSVSHTKASKEMQVNLKKLQQTVGSAPIAKVSRGAARGS